MDAILLGFRGRGKLPSFRGMGVIEERLVASGVKRPALLFLRFVCFALLGPCLAMPEARHGPSKASGEIDFAPPSILPRSRPPSERGGEAPSQVNRVKRTLEKFKERKSMRKSKDAGVCFDLRATTLVGHVNGYCCFACFAKQAKQATPLAAPRPLQFFKPLHPLHLLSTFTPSGSAPLPLFRRRPGPRWKDTGNATRRLPGHRLGVLCSRRKESSPCGFSRGGARHLPNDSS